MPGAFLRFGPESNHTAPMSSEVRKTRPVPLGVDLAKCAVLVIETEDGVAAFSGAGGPDYACFNCGKLFVLDIGFAQVRNVVFQCGKCRRHSEIHPGDYLN